MSKMCPICRIRRAISQHHVIPLSEGGADNNKNKVYLCKPCHDLVEEIYGLTGMTYSPRLIQLIRLGFKATSRPRAEIALTNVTQRKRNIKFRQGGGHEPPPTLVTCPQCGTRHLPKRFYVALCPKCSGEENRMHIKAEAERIAGSIKVLEDMKYRLYHGTLRQTISIVLQASSVQPMLDMLKYNIHANKMYPNTIILIANGSPYYSNLWRSA